ncbi:hypothetical protein HZB97_03120 [Candidatus Gottesmanbacteria bacterium]|nr:hypothetical protein [Candidatus Gottesmanbacteria bacterium]
MKKVVFFGLVLGTVFLLLNAKPLLSPTIQQTIHFPKEKIYVNEKYHFQFNYPILWQMEKWDLEEATGFKNLTDGTILYQGKFFGQNGHFEILIWQNKSKASVRNWLTWFRHEDLILPDLPQKENYSLAGLPAIRYLQQTTARKKPILYIFLAKDDKIYELLQEREDLRQIEATQSSQLAHPVYDQILASFKLEK